MRYVGRYIVFLRILLSLSYSSSNTLTYFKQDIIVLYTHTPLSILFNLNKIFIIIFQLCRISLFSRNQCRVMSTLCISYFSWYLFIITMQVNAKKILLRNVYSYSIAFTLIPINSSVIIHGLLIFSLYNVSCYEMAVCVAINTIDNVEWIHINSKETLC